MADLSSAEYAFLIVLDTVGREISNTEMAKLYSIRLINPNYEKLNAAGYVSSDTKRRPYRHVITAEGRKLLATPLTIDADLAEAGEKRSLREKQLWAALVAQQNAGLATANGNSAAPVDLEEQIRAVYADLAKGPGVWVSLTALRPRLRNVPKTELDEALVRMLDASDVRLEPEPFGHRVGAEERAAAVHVGGEDRHKLAIGLR